ncbi:hypothetical protein AWB85_19120 [Mycobacteroides immunogenum]|uniref:Uncharacterized protein n=1 Tax=Mycobacteroides immunogenum TaxID=83262 RepID=A0A179VFI7_9MYCO|nr:hypothetical protein AWB85_19120 [Mycobacteroides immunogenum]
MRNGGMLTGVNSILSAMPRAYNMHFVFIKILSDNAHIVIEYFTDPRDDSSLTYRATLVSTYILVRTQTT